MLSKDDKKKIENHLNSYLHSLSDFTFHNKKYERKLKAELNDLIKKLTAPGNKAGS